MAGDENKVGQAESGLTLEKARELLGEAEMPDEKLQEIVDAVKTFCLLSYELYQKKQERLLIKEESKIIPLPENNNNNNKAA